MFSWGGGVKESRREASMASVRSQSVAELVLCTVGRPGRRTSSSAVHSAVLIGVVGRAVGVVGLVVKTDDGLEAVFSELQKTFLHERVGDGSRPGGMVCSVGICFNPECPLSLFFFLLSGLKT